jgi:hypothetical protein
VRYGAWGDVLQMSSVLPALKEEGYHITLYTVPRGVGGGEARAADRQGGPAGHEQVPNAVARADFWKYLAKKYDKFVNLSESVEGSLLAMPRGAPFLWNTRRGTST